MARPQFTASLTTRCVPESLVSVALTFAGFRAVTCTVDVRPDVHPQQVTVVWTRTVTTGGLPQLLSFSRVPQP
ncbi:hypothetical protein CROQUDRAFT_102520 [Cronartium quercuum f. sp. fusiforme G11]|uniref:Uncharacterized protein n=1 Tax=Cronartium quercuum f. sp. fusiforme G11 TaxID=708437 RepID=A0A9P6N748_9BASI|nr:hypothetical protein CROQUDRAFT_102520 [Cronartium quercuum f. sp. fusiforme G11]